MTRLDLPDGALEVTEQGPDVRQQVVGQQHRLCVLQVGPPGHGDPEVGVRLPDEGLDDIEHQSADHPRVLAQVHPKECGDLVVA